MDRNDQNQQSSSDATNSSSDVTLFSDVTDVLDVEPYKKSLKAARIWLYVIAAFQGAMGVFEYFSTPELQIAVIALLIDVLIGAVFLALALWSRKNAVVAFTAALIFYVVVAGTFMFIDASNVYKGLLVKILVVMALIKATKDAKRYAAVKASLGTTA